jgi:hypothetical protein
MRVMRHFLWRCGDYGCGLAVPGINMLSTAPVGTRQEMRRKSPSATRCSVPSFPGDILDHAVVRKGGNDPFDVASIHAPHIARQCVVNLLTILQANFSF